MSRIPEYFIDDLISRTDIVDVINARVPLKQKGHEFSACCPFHNEKTPSFTVSPEKQFYHCFGCGANGSAIGFLMEYENLSFVESIESLANSNGMEVVWEENSQGNYQPRPNKTVTDALKAILEKSSMWYEKQLRHHPDKNLAVDYLKIRGLSGKICKEYHIGFAPKMGLLGALGTDEKSKQLLLKAGLLADNGTGLYERFRNRIQFPIHNFQGKVIGFGGRTLVDDKAKYYNSPETQLFHKSKELYGLYQARSNIKKQGLVLVVEGYMDVVALAQFGVQYAVATLGTATTLEHLKILFRTTDKIVCCFDGDKAGVAAAVKAMKVILPLMRDGRAINFMFLPSGHDPDSYIREHGKAIFEARIKKAKPLDIFLFSYLQNKVSVTSIDGRAKLADLAKPLLKQLSNGIYFELMLKKLASLTEMNEDKLRRYIDLSMPKTHPKTRKLIQKNYQNKLHYDGAPKILALLNNNPNLAKDIVLDPIFSESRHPDIQLMIKIVDILRDNPSINTGALYEKLRDIEGANEALNSAYRFDINHLTPEKIAEELNETLNILKQQLIKNQRIAQARNLKNNDANLLNQLIRSRNEE